MPVYELSNGEIFDGKFRIEDQLGQGGMAVVYRVTELGEVATEHALKLIRLPSFPSAAALATAKERFRHEAAMQARIRHPHIVGVHRYDVASDGTPYLLMELLEGQDLGEVLKRVRTLPWMQVMKVVEQTAMALTALHNAGLIHRDLSPGNIFLLSQGGQPPEEAPFVKLLDFGIARGGNRGLAPVTDPNIRIGNPPYMAPECILKRPRPGSSPGQGELGDDIDARADQFSLGCILFELLAGYKAFLPDGSDPTRAFGLVLNYDPLAANLPPIFTPALCRVLARALSKDPADRFATVAELVAALRLLNPEREAADAAAALINQPTVRFLRLSGSFAAAGGEKKAAVPLGHFAHLIPSQRTLFWTCILTTVFALCILAYRKELGALWSPPVTEATIVYPPHVPGVLPPDLGEPRPPDLAAAAEPADLARPEAAAPVKHTKASSHPANKPPPKYVYSFNFESTSEQERLRTLAMVPIYREKLLKCLAAEKDWKEVTVTFLSDYFISDLTEEQKQRAKRCLKSEMPAGKPLPRTTTIKRGVRG